MTKRCITCGYKLCLDVRFNCHNRYVKSQKQLVKWNVMKIVCVIGGLFRGGIENWLLNLSSSLIREGHEVVVVNITGNGDLIEDFLLAGVSVVDLGKKHLRAGTFRFDTTFKLRNVLKELSPDIIQTMHFAANYHTRLATIGLKVPVLTNIHTCVNEKKRIRRLANKILSFRTDMFVSVSEAVKQIVDREQNFFNKPSTVVYNGISDSIQKNEPVSLKEFSLNAGPVFVCVARLVPVKNISFFLSVLKELSKEIPDVSFLIIGDGKERGRLEAQAEELSLGGVVRFAGMRNDVCGLLAALSKKRSVFVMPSCGEGFLLAGLEAMAFGIPLALSEQIPLGEVAGEAALSLPLDVDVWRRELIDLVNSPEQLSHMEKVGSELAAEFHFSKKVEEWVALYSSMVSR